MHGQMPRQSSILKGVLEVQIKGVSLFIEQSSGYIREMKQEKSVSTKTQRKERSYHFQEAGSSSECQDEHMISISTYLSTSTC